MADTLLNLQSGSLPEGTCWSADPQDLFDQWAALSKAVFPGTLATFNFGNTAPTPENRDKPWVRTDASGNFDRIYTFGGYGIWVSLHPTPASGSERRLFVGSTTDLLTYDGGVNEPTSATTGPFWEVDTDFAAKIPIGPGTLPSTAVIAVGGTGGAETKTIVAANMPPHTHTIGVELGGGGSVTGMIAIAGGGQSIYYPAGAASSAATTQSAGGSGSPAAATAFDVMPPYRGIYFIKRTSRIYFTV